MATSKGNVDGPVTLAGTAPDRQRREPERAGKMSRRPDAPTEGAAQATRGRDTGHRFGDPRQRIGQRGSLTDAPTARTLADPARCHADARVPLNPAGPREVGGSAWSGWVDEGHRTDSSVQVVSEQLGRAGVGGEGGEVFDRLIERGVLVVFGLPVPACPDSAVDFDGVEEPQTWMHLSERGSARSRSARAEGPVRTARVRLAS